MDFLGIGLPELLVILILALLVVGPQRLPEMAAQLAKFVRTFRRYSQRITREFNETMQELEREYDDVRGEWKDVGQGLDDGVRTVSEQLRQADQAARDPAEERKPAASGPPG
jgi:Tat protein translocase TatB subunit